MRVPVFECIPRHVATHLLATNQECPVCCEVFTASSFLLLHCGHALCIDCQTKLLRSTCPTCKCSLRKTGKGFNKTFEQTLKELNETFEQTMKKS